MESIDNFALKMSQQPGPLVSFGENIVDRGDLQFFTAADAFIGNDSYSTEFIPGFLYGVTDRFSLFFNVPVSPGNKEGRHHSSGLEDIFFQPEYAFLLKKTEDSMDQATLVFNVTFPTGSSHKNPPTGFGSPSFFIGATYNHMETKWFVFFQPGAVITTSHHGTKFGNQYLYQAGYEMIIWGKPEKMIFAWMVEVDGTFSERDRFHGKTNRNSGGNIIYVTPSLWYSDKRFLVQAGPGFPVVQSHHGHQPTQYIAFFFNAGVKF